MAEMSGAPEPSTAEEAARAALETSHEAFVGMDAGGFITDWNPQAEVTFGWSREEAHGRVLADTIIPSQYREAHWTGLQRFMKTGEGPVLGERLELNGLHRDGYEFPLEFTISAQQLEGRWTFRAFLHDISARRRGEQQLRAQHVVTAALARAQKVEDVLPDVLRGLAEATEWSFAAYWRPKGEVMCCALSWGAGSELASGEFADVTSEMELERGRGLPGRVWASGEPAWILDVTEDPNFPRAPVASAAGLRTGLCVPIPGAAGMRGVLEFFSTTMKRPDPALVEMMAALGGQVGGFLDVLEERAGLVERLERLATTDELTGVANRRGWEEGLARELARSQRAGTPLYVALLDLDHFKAYNDEHGHQAGDHALREAGQAFHGTLRATDLVARYGGEEFALAFSTHPPDTAQIVIERVRAAVPGDLTCSAGVARWDGEESTAALIERADAALYQAKREGRDRAILAS